MAVDPGISLQGRSIDTATPIRQMQMDENNNALAAEQVLKAHYEGLQERDKQRLQSTIVGATQLKTYLDKGDIQGAHDFLVNRQGALHARMGAGENIDTQETDYALNKIRTGDIEGLKNDVNAMMAAGQVYGIIGGMSGAPANVQEWQYYNSLTEPQKQQYLQMKRANQVVDLGGKTIIPNQANPGGQPTATFDKTLKPEDMPANAGAKAAATAAGSATGGAQGDAQAKLNALQAQLPRLNQVVEKLHNLGQTATYTKAGVAANEVARQLGAELPQGANDRQAYITTIDNEVLPLLRQTFGAAFTAEEGNRLRATLGDVNLSPSEKDAALKSFIDAKVGEIQSLQRQAGASPAAPAAGGQIRVSNGKETFMIDPADLAAAQAEGFQQQ